MDTGCVCESLPLPEELWTVNSCCRGFLFFFNYIVTGELAERKKWNRGKGIDRPESMEGEYNHNTLYMFENGERSGGNLVWMAG